MISNGQGSAYIPETLYKITLYFGFDTDDNICFVAWMNRKRNQIKCLWFNVRRGLKSRSHWTNANTQYSSQQFWRIYQWDL